MKEEQRFQPLEKRLRHTVAKYGMLTPGDSVLIAVSGGADSMALLHSLHRLRESWGLTLAVAHLNHRLRGDASDQDAAFVREVSGRLGIPFHSEIAEVGERAAAARRNLEEMAREIRYEFLRRTALRVGAGKIALGHTLDDQAETVLMRFLRGSGSEGISAIHPVVDRILIRPLLECSRVSILNYLERMGIRFREDKSNLDLNYRRNRVRRELVPYLQENFNPRVAETLATEAEIAREVAGYLESQASEALESLRVPDAEGLALRSREILELHPALQKSVIRLALKEFRGDLRGVAANHIVNILKLCRPHCSGRRIRLPAGGTVLREFEKLRILPEDSSRKILGNYELHIPGSCKVREADLEFIASVRSSPPEEKTAGMKKFQAVLDPSSIPETLTIRSRLPGDRYGGMRHRKIKKMMIDAKVPLPLRDRLPMVLAGDVVIWIPGFQPAKGYIAQRDSGRCVVIEARKG